jgi:hypothetical protein
MMMWIVFHSILNNFPCHEVSRAITHLLILSGNPPNILDIFDCTRDTSRQGKLFLKNLNGKLFYQHDNGNSNYFISINIGPFNTSEVPAFSPQYVNREKKFQCILIISGKFCEVV